MYRRGSLQSLWKIYSMKKVCMDSNLLSININLPFHAVFP